MDGSAYFDYDLSVDGQLIHYASDPEDYSTDVLAGYATDFIRTTAADQPLFMMFTPWGSHAPAIPAPRHEGLFSNLSPWRPPSYNEADVSDKPLWVRSDPQLTPEEQAEIDAFRIDQYRTLRSVDDAVGAVLDALADTNRLSTTLIVYASDNGYLWGEHRQDGKVVPYDESIRVPMVVRYDAMVTSPRNDTHLALNIDLAPTFADLAGVPAPGAEGQSLLPLLASPEAPWRTDFLIEHLGLIPTYCGVRNERYTYVRYQTGEEELYDNLTDRWQLENKVTDPAFADVLSAQRIRLPQLCDPPPPGYQFGEATPFVPRAIDVEDNTV
jgi:arylsulfatase A-like enzyme